MTRATALRKLRDQVDQMNEATARGDEDQARLHLEAAAAILRRITAGIPS